MKVKISLHGEASCSTIVICSKQQYIFLKEIEHKMGDDINDDYSPNMFVEELK